MSENTIEITRKIGSERITDRINPHRIKFIKPMLHECEIFMEEDESFIVTEDFDEISRRIKKMES